MASHLWHYVLLTMASTFCKMLILNEEGGEGWTKLRERFGKFLIIQISLLGISYKHETEIKQLLQKNYRISISQQHFLNTFQFQKSVGTRCYISKTLRPMLVERVTHRFINTP